MNKLLLAILLGTGSVAATAQPEPPPHGPFLPRAEELATLPGVSAAQQAEIRQVLIQRRNAQEDIHAKFRQQFDTLHAKERSEHERVDEQASDQLRKLLGEEGYRAYAQWRLAHRGPAHDGPPHERGPGRARAELPPAGASGPGRAPPADDE